MADKQLTYPFRIVPAGREHAEQMIALLPLLASFDIPAWRAPEELWHADIQRSRALRYLQWRKRVNVQAGRRSPHRAPPLGRHTRRYRRYHAQRCAKLLHRMRL